MKTISIDQRLCILKGNSIIIMLRFSATSAFTVEQFCDDAQERLYDDIGASGHFRMAPRVESNLTEEFVVGYGKDAKAKGYYPRKANEFYCAFFIEETDPDVTLSEELNMFPLELQRFCEASGYSVEQIDIAKMY